VDRPDGQLWPGVLRDGRADRATGSLVEFGKAIMPEYATHPEFLHAVYTAMDVVRGILIASWATRDQAELESRWTRGRGHLRLLFSTLLEAVAAPR
jgi:hypothetical protein